MELTGQRWLAPARWRQYSQARSLASGVCWRLVMVSISLCVRYLGSPSRSASIWRRLVEARVDGTLRVGLASPRIGRRAVELEFHEVFGRHQLGRPRARHEVAVGAPGMPRADMAKGVDHAFAREDAVRYHELGDDAVEIAHAMTPFRSGREPHPPMRASFSEAPRLASALFSPKRTAPWPVFLAKP